MADTAGGADRAAASMRHIEHLTGRYPELTEEELGELLHWFRKEASAYDVGALAMKQEIGEGYRRFRADHIDRLGPADALSAMGFLAAFAMIVALIIYFAR